MGAAQKLNVPAEQQPEIETPIDHNYHQAESDRVKRWESTLPPAYWEYRRRWEQNPKQRVVEAFPIHLDIEATSACNMDCIMCPRTDMVNAGTFWRVGNFDFEVYTRLVDEGVQNGLASIKFNYLGEPTLNKRLVEMIRYAKKAGVVDVMFNTNASRLTEKLSRDLIEAGLDKLFFSFDSPYPDQYNAIRIGGDFHEVLDNIKRFHAIRAEMGSIKPFTRASMVLMRDNDGAWADYQQLMGPIVDAVAYVDYLDHNGQNSPDRMLVQIGSRKKKFCCPQLWQRMFVHPDGVATVCCVDSARELTVGNVREQTVSEIWTGDKYQKLRDLHAAGRIDEIPACARCPLARY
jgi:radical SAM protein with 4Fe4S-binding SPASM domain